MIDKTRLIRELDAERFEQTESGVLFSALGAVGTGEYVHRKNEGAWVVDQNTMTVEYLTYLLNAGMNGAPAAITSWFMTLFGTGQLPSDEWTANSFAALNTENVNASEGYTSVDRPAFQLGTAADGIISNSANPTRFTFASADPQNPVQIGGIATLSSNNRGGSSGILVSASNLSTTREFTDGDTYDVIYRLRLQAA